MQHLLNMIVALHTRALAVRDDRGATATEYALLVAFIAIALVAGVGLFGTNLNTWFNDLAGTVAGWAN